MVDAALVGTLTFAVSAGVATFFAPCAYPLLPGYVGYYLSREEADFRGALVRGVAATGGALGTLGIVGAGLLTVGHALVSRLVVLEPLVGVALVVLGGLLFVGRGPELRVVLPERRASVWGFVLFGAVYALAAAGCVVPVFLAVVTQSLTLPTGQAAVALAAYAGSVSLPLAGVTLLSAAGSDALRGLNRHLGSIQRVAAAIMILAGVWQIHLSLSYLGVY
ncbi:MAG: cytochrome c biogenesis CcdA family protein [Halobacteriota archaeon]